MTDTPGPATVPLLIVVQALQGAAIRHRLLKYSTLYTRAKVCEQSGSFWPGNLAYNQAGHINEGHTAGSPTAGKKGDIATDNLLEPKLSTRRRRYAILTGRLELQVKRRQEKHNAYAETVSSLFGW